MLAIWLCGIGTLCFKNIHTFINHTHETTMDLTLAKTIEGLSTFIKTVNPGMIIVHGDRLNLPA
jgi:UDP-N-acetylglucosamine 2-epimerase (hydrolysing)